MVRSILELLRRHPAYRWVALGGLLSSMGSGLTQVAVYAELGRLHAPASAFALAFALSVLPGLLAIEIGKWLVARYRPLSIEIALELFGALNLILPVLGSYLDSIALLECAQLGGAVLAAAGGPAAYYLTSRYFTDEELPALSGLSNYVFSANVLVGYGVGAALYGRVPIEIYYLTDLLSFLSGMACLYVGFRKDARFREAVEPVEPEQKSSLRWRKLSGEQKRAFCLYPALTLVATPAVALLPALATRFGPELRLGPWFFSSVTIFLFAKTLGQLVGPLLMKPAAFDALLASRRAQLGICLSFGLLYIAAAVTPWAGAALVAVLVAHLLSNLIYVVATYAIPRHFKGQAAATAAARQYQVQTTLIAAYSLASGALADRTGVAFVIGANILLSTLLVGCLLAARAPAPRVEV